jgi:exodeoxyribonuclease VII large subunit
MSTPSPESLVLTVSQFTHAIKNQLETSFPFVYLQGEITNCKLQSSGHLYFSLKDDYAQISGVMFKPNVKLLQNIPKGGEQVLLKGSLNVYPPKGNYQLVARELSYVGVGELLQKLENLKIKLHKLGWFKKEHKKPLPRFPRCIGVVTSPTGAVIQDILHILTRRFFGFHLILNPVKVQGMGAAQEIAQAIQQFNQHKLVDVLIVGRGGGNLEDLWAFNEEIVAQAIFYSQIPVISAVGHETDHCIADYVADIRAPTPSAAAEIVISDKTQHVEYLAALRRQMQQTLRHLIQKNHYRLEGLKKQPIFYQPHLMLEWRMQQLDDYRIEIEQSFLQFFQQKKYFLENRSHQIAHIKPFHQIFRFRESLSNRSQILTHLMQQQIASYHQKIFYKSQQLTNYWQRQHIQRVHQFQVKNFSHQLQALLIERLQKSYQKFRHVVELFQAVNPKNLLNKGFNILFAENKSSIIHSINQLQKGQRATLLLSDGEVVVTINEITPKIL